MNPFEPETPTPACTDDRTAGPPKSPLRRRLPTCRSVGAAPEQQRFERSAAAGFVHHLAKPPEFRQALEELLAGL